MKCLGTATVAEGLLDLEKRLGQAQSSIKPHIPTVKKLEEKIGEFSQLPKTNTLWFMEGDEWENLMD